MDRRSHHLSMYQCQREETTNVGLNGERCMLKKKTKNKTKQNKKNNNNKKKTVVEAGQC